jgi:hypothetical protein
MKPDGYAVFRSPTVNVFSAHRVLDPDPAKARLLIDGLKIYPYSQRENPAPTRHVSPAGRTSGRSISRRQRTARAAGSMV